MPDTLYLVAASLTMFAVTFALRALPFAALRPLRDSALVGIPEPPHAGGHHGHPCGVHVARRLAR